MKVFLVDDSAIVLDKLAATIPARIGIVETSIGNLKRHLL